MQVRKFEAKTIKDAIELVKFHLGPDAIILSAKDNDKNFGLMGEASVEVTAAVSESKLNKKKIAESKLDSRSRQKYLSSSAKNQKEYIEKSSELGDNQRARDVELQGVKPAEKRVTTAARYIDIDENGEIKNDSALIQPAVPERAPATNHFSQSAAVPASGAASEKQQISFLQNEILNLRGLIEKFHTIPQNFMTLHPGAEHGLPYEFSFIFKKLSDSGFNNANIVEILKIANEVLPSEQKKKRAFVDGWVIKYLLDHIQITEKPFKSKYHVFVGSTGQGKTSTVIKMACHLIMKERKRVAILSGDMIKVGAADQLKIYSQILNVPCAIVSKPQDWVQFEKAMPNIDHVLFDTPGVNLKNSKDFELLRNILPPHMNDMSVHLVQSVLARDADTIEVAERFKVIGFDDVIFTRLDEAVQYGLIYNFQKQMGVPLHSFGIGNNIPEDYEAATKERVVDLIFALSKIKKERGSI